MRRAEKMEETRAKLIAAARDAFADKGYAAASMDELCAVAGVTRGALYHNFGDKKGLLMAVVHQMDATMATHAEEAVAHLDDPWGRLLAAGIKYIEMALDPHVRRIVLLDGPAFLGDPSQWPSQNACLLNTRQALESLLDTGRIKPVDPEAAARLLNGAALNAALWIAASDESSVVLDKAVDAFRYLAEGLLAD